MRVIAGSAKRTALRTPEGLGTRPTTDRIKETLFNILAPELWEASFLDLFAGSGAIGIEALSRGASRAVFVDRSRKAAECIRENLTRTHLTGAEVLCMDASTALRSLSARGESFDIIFMDPPYRKRLEVAALKLLGTSDLLKDDTLIVMEMALDDPLCGADTEGFEILRTVEYKTNRHVFLTRQDS